MEGLRRSYGVTTDRGFTRKPTVYIAQRGVAGSKTAGMVRTGTTATRRKSKSS
jgi:hypothetical protein